MASETQAELAIPWWRLSTVAQPQALTHNWPSDHVFKLPNILLRIKPSIFVIK